MQRFARGLFGLALGLGAAPAGAATLALDFESLASGELVTTQFQSEGVVFANAVTVGVDADARICIKALSATHTLFYVTGWWVA